MNSSPQPIVDAAIFAQACLDQDLSLERLAAEMNLSPYHFHRLFKRETGETPAAFVQRLRLEQAAFRLLLHDDTIIHVALDCGYSNPETFTRAFRRHFGVAPRNYRNQQRLEADSRRPAVPSDQPAPYRVSRTRVVRLQPLPIAFLRNVGPYETVHEALWSELAAWAERKGLEGERMLIGIGHDAPGLTPPDKLRFDACITGLPIPLGTAGFSWGHCQPVRTH